MQEYESLFPYEQIREQQKEAIERSLKAFEDGKRFVIISAGTGVGKSAIGYTLARTLCSDGPTADENVKPGAWFVTTQKLLQDQYIKDYSQLGMCSIKSSSNYTCNYKKRNNCSESQQALLAEDNSSRFWKACTFNCLYKKEKERFLESRLSVTNFPYLMTEANYNGKITKRELLVIDEAHNSDGELGKFIEVTVSERYCKSVLKIKFEKHKTQHQAYTWIRDVYLPKLTSHLKHIKSMLEQFSGLKDKLNEFVSLSRQIDMAKSHKEKLETFVEVYDKENWVFENIEGYGRKSNKLMFKPIDVAPFSESMLFRLGEKVILMSATILGKEEFCETLGIDPDNAEYISIPSPFPVKNRPVFFCPMGKMTRNEIERSLPKLAKAIESILENHKNEKGIIHAHSYKIAKYIKQNVRSNRILIHNSENRDQVLRKHLRSKKPTVLLSPSMTEGVDLQAESSRFQILCKVPYPYLGDRLVKKRMNKWKWWYPMQTVMTILQSVGRSVRSESDHAVTYILDSNWEYFFNKNKRIFPSDFKKCLR